MKTVFISYSRDDLDFVENEIVSEIEKINGVNCWLDIHDIEADGQSAPIYNLRGQKVSEGYKGFVIRNGRKVLKR